MTSVSPAADAPAPHAPAPHAPAPHARAPRAADASPADDPHPGRRSFALAAAALTPLALAVGARRFASWDVWWQLAVGREALATGSSLPTDPFSWSMPGAPFVHKDLGGFVLLFLAWDHAGGAGVAALRALCALGIALGIGACIPAARRRPAVVALAGALAVCALQDRVVPRALVFSLALFPVVLALAERVRDRLREGAGAVRPLLPFVAGAFALQAVWMNLHRGAMLGVVVWTGLALATALASAIHRATRAARRTSPLAARLRALAGPPASAAQLATLAGIAAAALTGGLLTPSGVAAYRTGLQVTHDPIHRTRISEWAPWSLDVFTSLYGLATVVVAAGWITLGVIFVRALRGRASAPTVDLWHAGTLFVFTWQGFASIRWFPEATIVAAVVLGRALAPAFPTGPPRRAWWTAAAIGALALAWNLTTSPQQPGFAPEPDRYPERAMRFAHDAGLGPKIHNTFVYGGYALWAGHPRFRVLIDGRNDMVYPSAFYLRTVEAQADPERFAALREEHRGDWVLADNTPGRQSFTFLAADPAWMAVHWSEPAVVWVERARYPELAHRALRFVDPAHPVESLGRAFAATGGDPARLAEVEEELLRLLEDDPDGLRALTLLVLFYDALGPGGRASRDGAWDRLRAVHGDHPSVGELAARLNAAE